MIRSSGDNVGVGAGVDVGVLEGTVSVDTVSSITVVAADCSTSVLRVVSVVVSDVPVDSTGVEQAATAIDNAVIATMAIRILNVTRSEKLRTGKRQPFG